MTNELAGRTIVVTGATGGLGPAVVQALAARGAQVLAPAHKAVAAGTALPSVDVTDEAAVTALYASLPPLWASVHLVGGFLAKPLGGTTWAEAKAQLDVNYQTAFLCTREAARKLSAQGKGGRIVNVASKAALDPPSALAAYAASKAAVIALSRAAAAELRAEDILVNVVAPTIFDTPANRHALPSAPHDRWAKPTEIADVIAFLVSPTNRLVTGAVLPAGGRE